MRILVVVPHYYGRSHPGNNSLTIGSYIEPLGRIAALNALIVGLHRHFGRWGHTANGTPILAQTQLPQHRLDIVIITKCGHGVLDELGLAPETFAVEYVDCEPPWLGFQTQRIFRERLGEYDFYCYMEDDLNIHDPAFFDKLTWFQCNFGQHTLLQPVRYEMPAIGSPVKCVVDPELPDSCFAPFRRPGQSEQLEAIWNGRQQTFALPSNPHAASFFLTHEQVGYWMQQPTFDDGDDSWIGPLESAGTFSIGRVFDIYKPLRPDPFFLEVEHFGTRYASGSQADGNRYGESPILAIAQNALRIALEGNGITSPDGDPSGKDAFARIVRQCIEAGTAMEARGRLDKLEREIGCQKTTIRDLSALLERETAEAVRINRLLERERKDRLREARSLRRLLKAFRDEILRRWRGYQRANASSNNLH